MRGHLLERGRRRARRKQAKQGEERQGKAGRLHHHQARTKQKEMQCTQSNVRSMTTKEISVGVGPFHEQMAPFLSVFFFISHLTPFRNPINSVSLYI